MNLSFAAQVKIHETLAAIDAHRARNRRVQLCAILMGMEDVDLANGDTAPVVPWVAEAWLSLMGRCFAASKEFSEGPADYLSAHSVAVLKRVHVEDAINASAAPEEPGPCLRQMMHPFAVDDLVDAVGELPVVAQVAQKDTGAAAGATSGVDFVDLSFLILRHQCLAVEHHEHHLLEAFYRFDEGDAGLDCDEFLRLVQWTNGPDHDPDYAKLHETIEGLADAEYTDVNQTAAIDDADTFPVVILKATRCKLTYSESCRRHWTMAEDEPWDRAPPLTAPGAPAPRPDDDLIHSKLSSILCRSPR